MVVAGGSLGARGLNELVLNNVGAFNERHQVLHITGDRDLARAERVYRESGITARVLPFCGRMDKAYAAADLILCRAGGMTVAETCAAGLPSVFVPYPWHRDGHQFHNAGPVEAAGGGVILEESQATPERFCRHVTGLLEDGPRLKAMGESSRVLGKPHAVERIIGTIGDDLGRGGMDVA